jgi:hypothetical protein
MKPSGMRPSTKTNEQNEGFIRQIKLKLYTDEKIQNCSSTWRWYWK